jgi:hypothetical protein
MAIGRQSKKITYSDELDFIHLLHKYNLTLIVDPGHGDIPALCPVSSPRYTSNSIALETDHFHIYSWRNHSTQTPSEFYMSSYAAKYDYSPFK